jgi:hypothetical protein
LPARSNSEQPGLFCATCIQVIFVTHLSRISDLIWALLGCYAAQCCITFQKNADLINITAEAWSHE